MYNKLFKIKQEIGKLSKNATNPFHKSKYLDLNDLLSAVEDVLVKYNVLLLQPIENNFVVTRLINIDGNGVIESKIEIPQMNDPQKLGSAITYYRRYSLVSLLALQASDDDANAASGKVPPQASKQADTNKAWLNFGSPQWNKIIERVNGGEVVSLETIEKHYRISKDNKNKLIELGIN